MCLERLWWKPIPVILAGAAMGGYLWGFLDKNGRLSGVGFGVLSALIGCGVGYLAWAAIKRAKGGQFVLSYPASWLPLWLLGLMVFWKRLAVPHFGVWLLIVGVGGFLWMKIGLWKAAHSDREHGTGNWALPLGAAFAMVWEITSGEWNSIRLIIMAQVWTLLLLLIGRFVRRLDSGKALILAIISAMGMGGISFAAHEPHCNRLEDSAAFRCFADSYQRVGSGAVEWKANEYQEFRMVKINRVEKPALLVQAPATVIINSDQKAADRFFFGMIEESWSRPGDGVRFVVTAERNGEWMPVADKYIDPKHRWQDRAWVEIPVKSMEPIVKTWKVVISAGPEIKAPFQRLPDSRSDWVAVSVHETDKR